MKIDRTNLNKAFKEFKKEGYFAKQNFLCCQTCGVHAVPKKFENKYVFYHTQDNDLLKEHGSTYFSWCGDANQIISILEKHKIKTEWDGKNKTRIRIFLK